MAAARRASTEPLHEAVVMFDYEAVEETELSVTKGEVVVVREINDSGWCLVKVNGKTGWIPLDYVEKIDNVNVMRPQYHSVAEPEAEPEPEPQAVAAVAAAPAAAVAAAPAAAEPAAEPAAAVPEKKSEAGDAAAKAAADKEAAAAVAAVAALSKMGGAGESEEAKAKAAEDVQKALASLNQAIDTAKAEGGDSGAGAALTAALDGAASSAAPSAGGADAPAPAPASGAAATTPTGTGDVCHACGEPIVDKFVVAKDKTFHVGCFACAVCTKSLAGQPFIEKDGKFYCEDDFYRTFNPPCAACNDVIKGRYVTALGASWHPEHFVCMECNQPFTGNQFRKHEDKPYCEEHFNKLFGTTCSKCSKPIEGQVFEALGKKFHLDCFTCEVGDHPIGEKTSFHVFEERIYCPEHFSEMFTSMCADCGKPIEAQYVKVMDKMLHPECWKCTSCSSVLDRSTCRQHAGQFYCAGCYGKLAVEAIRKTSSAAPPAASAAATKSTDGPKKAAPITPGAARLAAAMKASGEASAADAADDAKSDLPGGGHDGFSEFYPYAALRTGSDLPAGVAKSRREQYLSDEDFERLFKMSKEKFGKLKGWKQQRLKKDLFLF